jgi:hypothetical protein
MSDAALAKENPWSLGIGVGRRPLVNIEPGVADYLDQQGYTEMFPEMENSVDFASYLMPYFILEGEREVRQWNGFKKDDLRILVTTDFASSHLVGGDVEREWYPMDYQGLDIGTLKTTWETYLQWYFAPGFGIDYSPRIFSKGKWFLKPSAVLSAGVSFFRVDVNLLLEYKPSDFVAEIMASTGGTQIIYDMGLWMEREIQADLYGKGWYTDPKFRLEIGRGPVSIVGQAGYRFERIMVHVVENEGKKVREADVKFNIDGITSEVLVKVDF